MSDDDKNETNERGDREGGETDPDLPSDFDADFAFERTFPKVPEEFHCVETGGPFEFCIECQLPLIDEAESPYSIAKVVQGDETILEWAMCGDCVERFRDDISEESKQAVADILAQAQVPPEHIMSPPEVKTSYCYLCSKTRDEVDGYSLQAVCSGHELISLQAPFMICHECEQKAGESLSKATRDHFDRFYEENFPGPPAHDVELPTRRPVVI